MVMRTIANKVGTIEVDGNSFYFLQPLSTFKTDEMEQIQQAYENRMVALTEKPYYLTAKDLTFQSGQVQYEYDLTGFKAFDYLKSIYFEDKLSYYLSLVHMAQEQNVNVLWQKENLVVDPDEKIVKAAIIENDELKLQNPKSREDAVKELIIVSLTSLNRVLGRPRRSDFFEQNEEVIRFGEMMYLRLKTLDEMEAYISQVKEEVEERKRMEAEERQVQEATKKRFSFPAFARTIGQKPSKSKNQTQQLMFKDASKSVKKAPNTKEGNKRFLLGAGGILMAALLLNIILTNANKDAQATDAGKVKASEEVNEEVNLKETYRQGILGNDTVVIEELEAIGYEALEQEDQEVLNALYLENGEYQKAIENNPGLAGEVTAKLVEEEKIEELQVLEDSFSEDSPAVAFEIALATEEWQSVLELRNQIELTDERIQAIVSAFIQTGDLQTAKAFVNEKAADNEEILERLLKAEKRQNELETLQVEKAKQQNIMDTDTDESKIKAAKERIKEIDQQITELEKGIEVNKGG